MEEGDVAADPPGGGSQEIKHFARDVRENAHLQNKVARANQLAVRAELGAEVAGLRRARSAGNLGVLRERQALKTERVAASTLIRQQAQMDAIHQQRHGLQAAVQRVRPRAS